MTKALEDSEPEEKQSAPLARKSVVAPISLGELADKITILEIKSERIHDEMKLRNVRSELSVLCEIFSSLRDIPPGAGELKNELRKINEMLWDIEDRIRGCELRKEFGEAFIELARSVYITNDRRASVKRQINEIGRSDIVDEKSYRPYA